MRIHVKLAKKYGAKVVCYRDLPRQHQLAIGHYMFLDGDAWESETDSWKDHTYWKKLDPTNKDRDEYDAYIYRVMVRNIPYFIKEHGGDKFGVGEIPTDVMMDEVLKSGWPNPSIDTITLYKDWVKKNTFIPNHSKRNRWPVILDDDPIIQDGWHRLNCYLLRGDKTIPVIYYTCLYSLNDI